MKIKFDSNIHYNIDTDEFLIENLNCNFHKPVSICIHVNSLCNLKCEYCLTFSNVNKTNIEISEGENLINFLSEYFPLRIVISGGEPLLYKNIEKLVSQLKHNNNIIVLSTNATIDLSDKLDLVKQIDWFDISLHGYDKESYYATRNYNGFQTVINNIQFLQKKNKRICLNYLIHKRNIHTVGLFFDLAKSLKVDKIRFANLMKIGSAIESNLLPIDSDDEFKYLANISSKYEYNFRQIVLPAYEKRSVVENGYYVIEPDVKLSDSNVIDNFKKQIKSNLKEHYKLFNGYEKY